MSQLVDWMAAPVPATDMPAFMAQYKQVGCDLQSPPARPPPPPPSPMPTVKRQARSFLPMVGPWL